MQPKRSSRMTDDPIKDGQSLPSKTKEPAPAAPDERDAVIERLERAIAQEREHSATLRRSLDELRFRTEILEKSYSKQLEDARQRGETAERELEEKKAELAALEAEHAEALRLLDQARGELERNPANRGLSPRAFASIDRMKKRASGNDDMSSGTYDGSHTINLLMADSTPTDDRPAVGRGQDSVEDQVPADQDSSPEELVAPDLVFTPEGDDDT